MEGLIVLGVLLVLAVPVALVLLLVWIGALKRRLVAVEWQVDEWRRQAADPRRAARAASPAAAARSAADDAVRPVSPAPEEAARIASPGPGSARSTPPGDRTAGADAIADAPMASSAAPSAAPSTPLPEAAAGPPPLPASERMPPLPPGPPRPPAPRVAPPAPPNAIDKALHAVKRWFTEGNVPVKIGMLVLLAGVAALLKYASDQGWLRMPIELRLAGIAAAALAALVFGWRQRLAKRSFALALQGGAIGVLLLTIFAAFKLHALMPAGAAFALSIVLVAGLGVLAVLQDSRTLAVLGILAGFLAPIWLSTGSGNHVALFSYYALLNAAIFGIAWKRAWRVLNLLGFAFTWGIGTAWGVLQYAPDKYATTQPFLALFFAFYLLLPILHAWRRPASGGDRIDGSLLFGTPLVAFSLQAALLDGARLPLAFCALGLAALYAVLAAALVRRERFAVLGRAHALLAVGFATLSVPLALSARATASVFALEGAGLVWLGLAQGRRLPRWAGIGLQLAAAFAWLVAIVGADPYWHNDARAIANPTFLGAVLIALAGFASAWAYRDRAHPRIALACYGWGLLWWCGAAIGDVARFVDAVSRADVLLAFAALTGWLAAEVHRRRPAPALVLTTLAAVVVALPLAFAQAGAHAQPFAGDGVWAWLAFVALGVRSLVCLRRGEDRFAAWAQFAWWLVWPTALSLLASWIAERFALADGWRCALLALPWLAIAWIASSRWTWLSTPLGARFDPLRTALQATCFALIAVGWCAALTRAGGSAPLPWLPLLNPLELAQLAALALLARWLWSTDAIAGLASKRIPLLAVSAFALVTCSTLRAVHHWGGEAWNPALVSTMLAQTSLTVVWSVLGVAGWIIGSRRRQRTLWLAGAVLMGVVLAKLVLVDRQHLGNIFGIASFFAYGLLCTLVGYFAPAPPRADADDATHEVAT